MRCVCVCMIPNTAYSSVIEVPLELGGCNEISKSEFTPINKNHSENVADLNH